MVVNSQIKKGLFLSLSVKKIKLVNIWQSYKHERGCLVHFVSLATTQSQFNFFSNRISKI